MVIGGASLQVDNKPNASDLLKMLQKRHKIRVADIIGFFHHPIQSRPLVHTGEHAGMDVSDVYEGESARKTEPGKRYENFGGNIKFCKAFYLLNLII